MRESAKTKAANEKTTILIVDDDPFVIALLGEILASSGYSVESATNGLEALGKYAEHPELDMIISDMNMPEMDGLCLIREIRKLDEDIVFVILTVNNEMAVAFEAIRSGADDYFLKDENIQETILFSVEKTLEKNRLKKDKRILERKVEERTRELRKTLRKVEKANAKITSSLEYAKRIQRALMPDMEKTRKYLPDSFFIWMPRDIVGGDIIFTDSFGDSFVIGVADCTGHGVPGAFMTMIASSGLKRIIRDEGCHDPADILKRLNFIVKTLLKQDTDNAFSNDGLDAGICLVKPKERRLEFSGAMLSLIHTQNDRLTLLKGDRQSIGYKKSDLDFVFTKQTIEIKKGMSFYMATDGLTDQFGQGERKFGVRRYKAMLERNCGKPFEEQKISIIRDFRKFMGDREMVDDVTVVGFGF